MCLYIYIYIGTYPPACVCVNRYSVYMFIAILMVCRYMYIYNGYIYIYMQLTYFSV